MKSIVTRGPIARTRSAKNTKPPLRTQMRWMRSVARIVPLDGRGELLDALGNGF